MLMKHVKLVGVTISYTLKWDTYVSSIVRQANVSLSMFKLLNKFSYPKIHSLPCLVILCLAAIAMVWHSGMAFATLK